VQNAEVKSPLTQLLEKRTTLIPVLRVWNSPIPEHYLLCHLHQSICSKWKTQRGISSFPERKRIRAFALWAQWKGNGKQAESSGGKVNFIND
jgi:hypothetical protein